tara:strand:- start:136 stop:387 length:252 start_codon:yes stop_codon:yes gene_type:complete
LTAILGAFALQITTGTVQAVLLKIVRLEQLLTGGLLLVSTELRLERPGLAVAVAIRVGKVLYATRILTNVLEIRTIVWLITLV